MFRKIINSGSLQTLCRISRTKVRLPGRGLSSQTHTNVTSQLLSPRALGSPRRHCSHLPGGESADCGTHDPDKGGLPGPEQQRVREEFNIDVLVGLLRQENAVDVCVIHVPPELRYTNYFITASGVSTRHLRAMATYALKVYKFLKSGDYGHVRIEGKDAEDWMCIDFGDMVLHLMLPSTRETYELEKLWTLRHYDDQLCRIPPDILPPDFIYGADAHK
ncbi:mitochondrial assembly of ribosomal large subunit protein 1 [Engraulis encrasicolus]|uniref:mitochondrial assembly of ribosomal large subunit protein 1 n=1 Tax=Engraulis encrasicolus TaxID=184585 RepID=UPI002FCED088